MASGMDFTNEECYQIVLWHGTGKTCPQIIELFHKMFPGRPLPTRSIIARIVQNLRVHGCFSLKNQKNRAAAVVPRIKLNPDRELREIMVCAAMQQDSTRPTVDIAREFNISKSSVCNILQRNGYRTYRPLRANEIFSEDTYLRMEFCERVMEIANRDENFISNIIFTDAASFPIHGRHNPSINRYWSRENERRTSDARKQHTETLNVWAGILGNHIVGPFFIEGTLDAQRYLALLQNEIIPAVCYLGVPLSSVWFQQGGGSDAQNAAAVREYLLQMFPNRLLARFRKFAGDGQMNISWPPRSPDLTPCEFFLWGYVKSKIYGFQGHRANNLNKLRLQIVNALKAISPEMLANVRAGFYNRLGYCLAQGGDRFEHLLN
ncbi:unnamed protein product [Phyllotreta striolata]|uniref:DUF4817 domain-containing protein n=1 Tax=Phyllotreta striolata TaxID=444603 RepID=A0A9N9XJ73_PHYSR|nr:unnamed protein product [Phyllotreta striolata]